MKKLFLSAALTLATFVTYGQGNVWFSNATSTWGSDSPDYRLRFGTTAPLFDSRLTPGSLVCSNSGGVDLSTLRAVLLYGAGTMTRLDQLSEAPAYPSTDDVYRTFRGTTSANPGAWFSSNRTFNGAGGTFYSGDTVSLAVVVWDTRYAATSLEALAECESWNYRGLIGYSSVFQYTIPTGTPVPTQIVPQFTPFSLEVVIPEPSTVALVGLGATALLLRRWRKC